MVWPTDSATIKVEILLSGTWTDITAYVRTSDGIVIQRGRRNESSTADASTATLTINNRDGRFSPRNPTGPYYGSIGRNTQLRISATAPGYRFWGEVSEWPHGWDTSGRDVHVSVVASGVMRRLSRAKGQLRSAYYRGCTSPSAPVTALRGYWSMEDQAGSQSFASGVPGGIPAQMFGAPTLASDSSSFVCSGPLPAMGTCAMTATIPGYAVPSPAKIQARFLMAIPAAGTTNGAALVSLRCTGTAVRWEIVYGTGGALTLIGYNAAGTALVTDGPYAFNADGMPVRVSLSLAQNGTAVDYDFATLEPGKAVGGAVTGSLAGNTISAAKSVVLAPGRNLPTVVMGHLTVQSTVTSVFDLALMLNGNATETAADRVTRLCAEEGVTATIVGTAAQTALMGYQQQGSLLSLLRECEGVDGGLLYEPRGSFGIAYRTRLDLCNQAAAVTLSHAGGDIKSMAPVEDDQTIVNDCTASRPGGTSYRYTATSGALSTLDPPDGVGTYDASVTVNPVSDEGLRHVASWRVHLGTVDEERYPEITVDLARPTLRTDATKTTAVHGVDIGGCVVVSGRPAWLPPGDASQVVIGTTERIALRRWETTWVGTPESAYRVGVYGTSATASRYSPSGSTLAGTMTTTSTSRTVNSGSVLWTTSSGDRPFDIMVGGEQMTVTNVTGSSSPQTFTVTRSVNGVVKAHASGEPVELYAPAYYGH